jgi:multidrug efflux pump subunit AcrA (membrane-fusion protein)
MTIEAEAVLEPKLRRAIFSSVDGFVDSLLVEDGQTVEQGQLLGKLRSPALNLQIEETIGQIKSVSEKRNGLRVAVNQVSNSTPEALVAQTRISAEILLLEAQEKQTRDKLDFLVKEQGKLEIVSPIHGVVVSRDLRRELETRPLRRGDILFQVADLEGQWQLNVQVADRDSTYLKKHLAEEDREALFVFDSLPREQFRTAVQQVSATVENPTGTAPYLLVVADIENEVAKRAYMGANARVWLSCGEQPLWFVWCRPMVEALQKRAWLPTITSTNEGEEDEINK